MAHVDYNQQLFLMECFKCVVGIGTILTFSFFTYVIWVLGNRILEILFKRMASLDHIISKSKGGQDTPDNLRTLCLSCNSKKNDSDFAFPVNKPAQEDINLIVDFISKKFSFGKEKLHGAAN